MRFQTAVSANTAEKVFRVARNSYTKTATITAASFVRGNPVILTIATASNDGNFVIHPDTAGQSNNELFVGCVADYPDTTTGQTGVWQPETPGWIQCYGVMTNAVVANATVTIGAPLILVPNTGSQLVTIGALTIPTGSGTADTGAAKTGVAGLAVLYGTLASSSAAGTAAATVFIRAM
jgi:hypothetical protein